MIYHVVRGVIKIALSVFFKNIVVTGKEHIPASGPLIIVANHPNTFMDPMIIAAITEQRIGFVANAGIFTNKFFIAVFRYFHVIPIFRKKDVAEGVKPDNKESFVKCHEYLKNEGTFLIFPEGSSYYELKLREIKTGTARIALSFEKMHNFESNLKILPVALDYSDSIQFRSKVSVIVNAPLVVGDYNELFLKDEFEGVNRLTEAIRKSLAQNVPQTSGKAQEEFLIRSHKFYTSYFETDSMLHKNTKQSLELRTQLSKALHYTKIHNNDLYCSLQTNLSNYFDTMSAEGLTTGFFTEEFLAKNKAIIILSYLLKFVLFLPFYLVGLLVNYLPYIIPSRVFNLMKLDISYKAPVQMIVGLITFPFFYVLAIVLFRKFISAEFIHTLLFLGLLPVSAYMAIYYWTEARRFKRVVRFVFFTNRNKMSQLISLRNEILNQMEAARKELLAAATEPR